MDRKKFCNEITELIEKKGSKIVFFTGAGISYNPPSSLPLANEVKLELIRTTCENFSLEDFYNQYLKQIKENLKNILMESIFEIIEIRSQVDAIKMIEEIFGAGKPNCNHKFLARLLSEGKCCYIITTNFDILIEKALKVEQHPKIIHLHGSISDPDSIRVLLHQIGWGLPEEIQERLKEVLKNKVVIFVGWSGNDFDIIPILSSSEMEKIYWIYHDESSDRVICYNDDEIKSSSSPIDSLIKQFEGIKYIGSTDVVIREIWQRLWKDSPEYPKKTRSEDWKKSIKKYLKQLGKWDRALIFLEVLERIDRDKKLPLKLIDSLEKVNPKGQILYELSCKKSVCYRIISEYNKAIEGAEQVLKTFTLREGEDLSWFVELKNDIASAYNDWGKFLREKGNYEEAIEKHIKAIEIFKENIEKLSKELDDTKNRSKEILILLDKAQVHTNLGSAYFDLYKTMSRIKNKEKFFLKEIFNKEKIIKKEIEKNYQKAIEIREKLQNELKELRKLRYYNNIKLGDLYNNLANTYSFIAEKYNAKCLEIKRKCGDVRGMKRLLDDIKKYYNEYKDLKDVHEILEQSFIEEPISSTHLLYYRIKLLKDLK